MALVSCSGSVYELWLTLDLRHVHLLGWLSLNGVQSEITDDVEDSLHVTRTTLIGILAFCGSVGTLKLETFTTNSHHGTVDFPEAITNVDDLVGIGQDFVLAVGCEILRISISTGTVSRVACDILGR